MEAIQGLLAIWLTIAGLAFIVGGPEAAGRVFSVPTSAAARGIGWMLGEVLGAIGRGIAGVLRDIHRYFYRWWPGWTVGFYLLFVIALMALALSAQR